MVAPCPHELPAALLHFLDGLRKNVADLRVQSDGRLDACCVEHIRDTPQADAYPVFAPGVVEDVRNIIRGIGADADAEGGVVLPDLHIRREPDRKRVVARPLEGLALGDERVVVALRAADRPRRGLRLAITFDPARHAAWHAACRYCLHSAALRGSLRPREPADAAAYDLKIQPTARSR